MLATNCPWKRSCCSARLRRSNTRRIPRTQADVDKAYSNGIVEGLNRGIDLMLYVLIDKHDAPMDDVQQLGSFTNPQVYGVKSVHMEGAYLYSTISDTVRWRMDDISRFYCEEG